MGRKSSLTPEKLAKDINFFEGYVAKCEIAFIAVDDTLVGDFISKYTQDDVIVEPVSINDYIVHFNIYSNGEKQLHSLINIMSVLHHESILENLAETIYEELVTTNFKDLEASDELLVYEIACINAQQRFNDLCQ